MSICLNTRKLCNNECEICFNKSFASIDNHKFITDKKCVSRNISKFSSKTTTFHCIICNHNFEAQFRSVSMGKWCPYCAIPSKILCDSDDCDVCFERSFASHEKSTYLSIKNNINPRYIFKNANCKYIFTCDKCNHDFNISPLSINHNMSWCPYCSNTLLCDDNKCDICFNKSFASHIMNECWSDNNIKTARQVFIKSNDKYLLYCKKCHHEFISRLADMNNNSINCPYCSSKILCSDDNCKSCFDKSFSSHNKSKYFSIKNKINTRTIFKSSGEKYIFDCNICNSEFLMKLHYITSKNYWCPYCVNKTEKKLNEWLNNNYTNISFQINKKWCNKLYRYDFILEDYKIIIELDGPQHFYKISNWLEPIETLNADINKINNAINNNYSIIHILQIDVFNDNNDWNKKLQKYIIQYDKPTIIFINNKDNIYIKHIESLDSNNIINDIN